jgi:hypothetical protein
MMTSVGWRLIGYAEDVAEAPVEPGGTYLAQLLARLASIRLAELDHTAIADAMGKVQADEPLDQNATIWSLDLFDQSEDVTRHVSPDLAIRTLYTLLHRASEARPEQLTHQWIAETTATAVRHYRASDAVNASRGAVRGRPAAA